MYIAYLAIVFGGFSKLSLKTIKYHGFVGILLKLYLIHECVAFSLFGIIVK